MIQLHERNTIEGLKRLGYGRKIEKARGLSHHAAVILKNFDNLICANTDLVVRLKAEDLAKAIDAISSAMDYAAREAYGRGYSGRLLYA